MSKELIEKALTSFVNKDEAKAKEYLHEFFVRRSKALLNETWEKDEEHPEFGGDYDDELKDDIVDAQDEIENEMTDLAEDEALDNMVDEEGLADRVMDLEQGNSEVSEKIDVLTQSVEDFKSDFAKAIEELKELDFEDMEVEEEVPEIEDEVEVDEAEEIEEIEELEESAMYAPVKVPAVKPVSSKSSIPEFKEEPKKDVSLAVAKSSKDTERKVAVKTCEKTNTKKNAKDFMKPVK